jgi:hypothetical protein
VFDVDVHGAVRTRAATSGLARHLDSVQIRLGEGPLFGIDEGRSSRLLEVPHLEHDRRWPGYAAAAAAVGLRAQLVVRVPIDDRGAVAGLNLYSTHRADIHPDAGPVAELFAGHAAATLRDRSHGRSELDGPELDGPELDGPELDEPGSHRSTANGSWDDSLGGGSLTEAMRAREVVGLATGIIADRYQMTHERAFAFLVRAASQSNMRLREVAQELVDRHNGGTSSGTT